MANIEDGVKYESSTLGSICSISKLFTAVAVMKLYDRGKLRLDDLVSELLPWYDLKQQYAHSGAYNRQIALDAFFRPSERGEFPLLDRARFSLSV